MDEPSSDHHQLSVQLIAELRRRRSSDDPSEPDGTGLVDAATGFAGTPTEHVHLWHLALELALVGGSEGEARAAVDGVAARLLDRNELPRPIERTTGLRLLELLVLAATVAGRNQVALQAVQRLSIRTNELFLETGMSGTFLAVRPEGRHLRTAAHHAFGSVDRHLAFACAEAGRMKLLSAASVGHLTGVDELAPAPSSTRTSSTTSPLRSQAGPSPGSPSWPERWMPPGDWTRWPSSSCRRGFPCRRWCRPEPAPGPAKGARSTTPAGRPRCGSRTRACSRTSPSSIRCWPTRSLVRTASGCSSSEAAR